MKKNLILLCVLLVAGVSMFCIFLKNGLVNGTVTEIKKEYKSELPDEILSTSKPSSGNNCSKFARVFGEWLVIDRIGDGYVFNDTPEEDYIGGRIIISDELVQTSMPNEELNVTLKDPEFLMQWQSAEDFFMGRYARYESFGFEDKEKVPLIEISENNETFGFGSRIWIKDENHIVILGPQYFLAERQGE